MIKLTGVLKTYGSSTALQIEDLSFASGGIHAIVGSSGSGKTTLLRALLNLIRLDRGAISFDGQDATAMTTAERATKLGYVPQDALLFPHLSTQDNITLIAKANGWTTERMRSRLSELDLVIPLAGELMTRYPHQLSGGQRQRVALQRALFLDPKLVLLDEPFGALDPVVRADVQSEFKSLFLSLGKTALFVTHDIGEAAYLADDIVLMHEGQVLQRGSLDELATRPAVPFVSKFLRAQRSVKLSDVKP